MSDEKPIASTSPDDLTKSTKPGDIQLNEEELKHVAGGLKITLEEVFITNAPVSGSGGSTEPEK